MLESFFIPGGVGFSGTTSSGSHRFTLKIKVEDNAMAKQMFLADCKKTWVAFSFVSTNLYLKNGWTLSVC